MFPYPIATPQGCNIQTFYGSSTSTSTRNARAWNKPVGVSHIYMMLIGAGGPAVSFTGGGSGAVTVWYGAAQHVPDSLLITPAARTGAADSVVYYRGNSLISLLTASGTNNTTGAPATTAGPFAASGFYKSTAGQNGSNVAISASSTTFLGGGSGSGCVGNYGYAINNNEGGFFQMQPIIVGVGSSSNSDSATAIGCGAGANGASVGGPGMVLIASW